MKRAILKAIAAALLWFAARLSPATSARLGILAGDIGRILDKRHRDVARLNLRMVYGDTKSDAEIEGIIKECFRGIGQTLIEFLQIPSLTLERGLSMIAVEGRERLDKCLEAGKGVVLLGSHFGNWELMAAAGSLAGYTITAVARPLDNVILEEIVERIRKSTGLMIVPRRVSALGVVRKLKRNEIVGILADQNTRKYNIFVDFLGIKAATTPGPAAIALRTGAALVPAFLIREGGGRHRFVIEKPIEVVRTGDDDADILATTQKCVDVLERYVRQYPAQWSWIHRRWRTRPPGEPPIY